MSTPNVAEEIENIRKSLENLSSQVIPDVATVTAGSETDYGAFANSTGTGQDHLRSSKDYVHLAIDAAIAKTELNQERRITEVQKEILSELGSFGKEIQANKPQYFLVFVSVFLASVLTLAAIFVPIIPIYSENVVNGKMESAKKSIVDEVEKLVVEQMKAGAQTGMKK
jgi:hypothetical protein